MGRGGRVRGRVGNGGEVVSAGRRLLGCVWVTTTERRESVCTIDAGEIGVYTYKVYTYTVAPLGLGLVEAWPHQSFELIDFKDIQPLLKITKEGERRQKEGGRRKKKMRKEEEGRRKEEEGRRKKDHSLSFSVSDKLGQCV